MTTKNTIEALLNEHDVARITGLSPSTVRRWRLQRNQGPEYLKIGSAVRYKEGALRAWIENRHTGGTKTEAA